MKLLVVLVAITALCAGSAIPSLPRDDSHYFDGGDDDPTVVDIEAPLEENSDLSRSGARNAYWLFTRRNRSNRQVLTNGNANSIRNSNYNGNLPTVVIAHGWISNGNSGWIAPIRNALLDNADVNIIVLDWNRDAVGDYRVAARNVPAVGQQLTNFLNFLFNTAGGQWNRVHLVGHSLGAHVVGNAGRAAGGRAARITGLDPAGPRWDGNSNILHPSNAVYVESIHTNDRLGISNVVSDVDFFPNGGRNQPGCLEMACDHDRATQLFAASIGRNHLVGRRCNDLAQAKRNQCTGATLVLGNDNLNKRGSGIYALSTGRRFPF